MIYDRQWAVQTAFTHAARPTSASALIAGGRRAIGREVGLQVLRASGPESIRLVEHAGSLAGNS